MDKIFFIGYCLGFISSGIIIIISHFLSVSRDRRKEFNQAAAKFKSAFIGELVLLSGRELTSDPVRDILIKAHPKHYEAFLVFGDYLNKTVKANFEKAWKDYCYPDGNYNSTPLITYGMNITTEEGTSAYGKEVAINNIKKLLTYASHNKQP